MNITHWNCNGLHAHIVEIQELIAETKPDYLCLQETRLREQQKAQLNSYTAFRKDRQTERNANGGVAIFMNNKHHVVEINIQSNLKVIAVTTLCEAYIKRHKKALYTYRKNKTTENLIVLNKSRAEARRIVLQSKNEPWQNFTATITASIPPAKNSKTITSPLEIAITVKCVTSTFGRSFSNIHKTATPSLSVVE
ncbi:hypothetical protein CBL_20439 [Carabus blaptoides fortunei]